MDNTNNLSWILNHLGEDRENYYGAVSPPIMLSASFAFPSVSKMRADLERELEVPFYTRGYNPTVAILRKKVAALEGAEDALVFSSGSAAVSAAVMSVVKSGDHIICVQKPYSWSGVLISAYLNKYGVQATFVDGSDPENFFKAKQPNTKAVYIESPNSMTFELQNISAITKWAKSTGITSIIDNTYSSPLNQSPISLGVDIVVHSGTKYLNGHSDVIAGVVASTRERISKMMAEEYMTLGAVIGAHDAWMMIRGLRTLELRVNRSSISAQMIAEWLEKHPKIRKVHYPTLKSNRDYELAVSQMKCGGGLLSVELNADSTEQVERFCDNLKCFLLATSWGGHESLCLPVCALRKSASLSSQLPFTLVRLYLGLEDPELLKMDLEQALAAV